MSDIEFWLVVAAGVGSILSLVATVFSAIAAARSADVALKAEARAAASERASEAREQNRLLTKVTIVRAAAKELLHHATGATRGLANLHGTLSGSRQKQIEKEIDTRIAHLDAMTPNDSSPLAELDAMLVMIEDHKEWAERQCDKTEQERQATLARNTQERSSKEQGRSSYQ